jgi:hypothetical protein
VIFNRDEKHILPLKNDLLKSIVKYNFGYNAIDTAVLGRHHLTLIKI